MKKTREQIQSEAAQALKDNNGGTVHIITGGGKSKITIDYLMSVAKPYDTVLIVVPLTTLIKNWKNELSKFTLCGENPNGDYVVVVPNGNITVSFMTVQSAYKLESLVYTYLIVDEIHTIATPEYSRVFKNFIGKAIVGLTATTDVINRDDKQSIYDLYCPIVYEYLDGEADGIVNKIQFHIIEHQLDNNFKILTGPKKKQWQVGELKYYEYLTNQIKIGQIEMAKSGSSDYFGDASKWFWQKQGDKFQQEAARKYLGSITQRRKFLVSLQSTAEIAKKLAKKIISENDSNKVLIFSEEVKQLHKICKYNVYGEQKEDINNEILTGFNSGDIRAIGSCYSLTLGVNLKGANNAILESYNGSDTKSTQRIGRLHRLGVDDVANVYIIKVLGTQAEKWFDSMMTGYDLSDAIIINSKEILTTKS